MNFIENIKKERYEEFVKNHKTKSHFLQSYAWGEFSKKEKNMTPHYLGVEDENNNLIATALLLQKHLPLGYSYFYSPRGFVIDFTDSETLSFFTEHLKEYIKNKKGIFLKIDPDIIWKEYDYKDNLVKDETEAKRIFYSLTKLGYTHLGFTKNFETMQPRYTFRISLKRPFEEIENNFTKTVKQRMKKGEELGTRVTIGKSKDVKEFSHLMDLTEDRKDFLSHEYNYYKNLYDIYNKENKMTLFLGKIKPEYVIKKYQKEQDEVIEKLKILEQKENLSTANQKKKNELAMRKNKLQEYIDEYNDAKNKYGKEITLNAHMLMEYGNKCWTLYAGNHNVLISSQANYKTYYEHIKYAHKHGFEYYDHFGTIGDLTKENPRYGLHIFKKAFGGNYIEFIGEFDLILNKPLYFIFTKLVPLYRKLIRKLTKRKKEKELKLN